MDNEIALWKTISVSIIGYLGHVFVKKSLTRGINYLRDGINFDNEYKALLT